MDNTQDAKMDKRVKYTKMFLRESLIDLMLEKPITRITIKELCQKADVNRGTFYAHYTDQYDLLKDTETALLNEVSAFLLSYSFEGGNPNAHKVISLIFEYVKNNSKAFIVLLGNNGGIDFQMRVMEAIHLWWSENSPSSNLINSPAGVYISTFVTIGSIGVVQRWIASGFVEPADDMAALVMELANNGLAHFYGNDAINR